MEAEPLLHAAVSNNARWCDAVCRSHGYPGEFQYLEFHKKHFPGGLRFWRITDHSGDLGRKQVYDPKIAAEKVGLQAAHFVGLVRDATGSQTEACDEQSARGERSSNQREGSSHARRYAVSRYADWNRWKSAGTVERSPFPVANSPIIAPVK